MGLLKIKFINVDFMQLFAEKRKVAPFYLRIENKITQKTLYNKPNSEIENHKGKHFLIYDIPNYLETKINSKGKNLKSKKIATYKGFLIQLYKYKSINDYLNVNSSAKSRSKFRTYQKRLELCFNIKYEMYFGDISKKKYDYLFNEFKKILERRSIQKHINNENFDRWDYYYEITYPLILEKKACLFVIYDGDKPINICLNLTRDQIIFGYIRTFDIDYTKFNIGFIDMIKQIEWAINNNFEIFDLLKGDFEYKRRWADYIYENESHYIYDSSSLINSLGVRYNAFKTEKYHQILDFLKKRNLHLLYRKYKIHKYNRAKSNNLDEKKQDYVIDNNLKITSNEKLRKVHLQDENYAFLKNPVYHFLYSNFESINDIQISQIVNIPNAYLIEGKNNSQKIIVNV